MIENDTIRSGTEVDEMKIIVNSLYLGMSFLLDRLAEAGGQGAAIEARAQLIENLQNGNIDMAIMEDRKLFDFVVSVADALPLPQARDAAAASH